MPSNRHKTSAHAPIRFRILMLYQASFEISPDDSPETAEYAKTVLFIIAHSRGSCNAPICKLIVNHGARQAARDTTQSPRPAPMFYSFARLTAYQFKSW